ncbi:hypothetical protein E1A91_A01G222700v1 [Gossypium mustelinum]|uniref:Histone deacetylase interacting domain-containing protein n=1 Tax=Gossypium mustelinum TaxID=34275 RepID=A0A5D3AL13_GOSMU|nr:hypothetical protein E1A91_A01G222700v1 [Gossypium mustelinum]
MEAFLERVKEHMKADQYTLLLKCVDEFNNGGITVYRLNEIVEVLLREYPGFFTQFEFVLNFANGVTRRVQSADSSNKGKRKLASDEDGEIDGLNETKDQLAEAMEFCEKVMKQTSYDKYLDLLKHLYSYGTGKIIMVDLKTAIAENFQALGEDFDHLFEFYTNISRPTSSSSSSSESEGKKLNQEVDIVKESCKPRQKGPSLESKMSNKKKKPKEEIEKVRKSYKVKREGPSSSSLTKPKKEINKPEEEELEKVTESYYLLPENLSGVHSTEIDEIGKQVLNFSTFSKGVYNTNKQKGPEITKQEMLMNRKEDEMFVMDMQMEWLRSTKKNAMKLFQDISERKIKEPTMADVDEYFTSSNYRYLVKMYNESGPWLVDRLRHAPKTILPVIIKRLKQKDIVPYRELCQQHQQMLEDQQ